jgi:hypothetical protein
MRHRWSLCSPALICLQDLFDQIISANYLQCLTTPVVMEEYVCVETECRNLSQVARPVCSQLPQPPIPRRALLLLPPHWRSCLQGGGGGVDEVHVNSGLQKNSSASLLKGVSHEICMFLFRHIWIGLGLYKNL